MRLDIADKEVIISAGALDTPKLLMISGIGSREELDKHGIESVHHLPGVGQGLKDHLYVLMFHQCREGIKMDSLTAEGMAEARAEYFQHGTGPFASERRACMTGFAQEPSLLTSAEFIGLPSRTQAFMKEPSNPSFEFVAIDGTPVFSIKDNPERSSILAFSVFPMNVQSAGTVTLSSNKLSDPPVCDPKLLSSPYDRRAAIVAVKKDLEWVEALKRSGVIARSLLAPATDSEDEIWAFIKSNAITSWHMACTVRMGKPDDEDACVDSDFRVLGLENLRVVDMSVCPFLPNCHTQSIAYWLGELAAQKIAKEYGL